MTHLPKRLIEVDLPIARISAHARREKSIRHGHISTLHIWWARRPLAACRAVICAALWPDPADEHCPQSFREAAARRLVVFAQRVNPDKITDEKRHLQTTLSPESRARWEAFAKCDPPLDSTDAAHQNVLRFALLDFIADFANWDNSTVPAYLETSRALTQAAHEALGGEPGTRPLVVDPFAGGGSIPLEALRVGADAFASDLNPVAVLLNKVVLEYIPKYGQKLADEVRKWGAWIKEQAEKELAEFYPKDEDGATPIAYLWARTIRCEGAGCGAEVPLMRSLWLAKKGKRSLALQLVVREKHRLEAVATRSSASEPAVGGTGFQPVREETLTRRNLPHIQLPGHCYHVIFRTKSGSMPQAARQIALDACLFWNGKKTVVHACAVMPDHVHLLMTPTKRDDGSGFHSLTEILHSIKSFSANKINKLLGRSGAFWLDESYDRYIRSESDFEEKYNYVRNNPVKDGLVSQAEDYPFLYLQWPEEHRLEAGATQSGSPPMAGSSRLGGTGFQPVDKSVDFEIIENAQANDVGEGTVKRGSATCPCCGYTTPVKSVREQLKKRHGGAADARLFCVVTTRPNMQGRFYRLPTERDLEAVRKAATELERRKKEHKGPLSLVPDEKISPNELRRISVPIYGMQSWGDLFSPRQALSLSTLVRLISRDTFSDSKCDDPDLAVAVATFLGIALSRFTDICNALCMWETTKTQVRHAFTRQAIGMLWDFAEPNVFADAAGDFSVTLDTMLEVLEATTQATAEAGHTEQFSATAQPLPDGSASAILTDPPYYDAVPYAYLSDFFYVWMRRTLAETHSNLFRDVSVPKDEEIVVDRSHKLSQSSKGIAFYERELQRAFVECRRVLSPSGICTIVFASKTTASWEAILQAVVDAGWTITGSWPIDTEMENRIAAQGQARLASSVHLVCRPRTGKMPVPPSSPSNSRTGKVPVPPSSPSNSEGVAQASSLCNAVGDWRDVLSELPQRMHEWMPRLASEGVVGADAIFACLGPALEIFSRYSRVEKANGEQVLLKEYLEHVWAAVSKEALSTIFRDADASGLEPDARLTAMWLWTIGGAAAAKGKPSDDDEADDEESDDEDEVSSKPAKAIGFALEFDAARKIAQGLGIHLERSESIVAVKGDKARLLAAAERTKHLFGKDTETGSAGGKRTKKKAKQRSLFEEMEAAEESEGGWKELKGPPPGTTILDRLHQAMILFGAQRGEMLKRFLVEDGVGKDARFWKLAQSLAALYPPGSDERRWVEGVLARKKGLGL